MFLYVQYAYEYIKMLTIAERK